MLSKQQHEELSIQNGDVWINHFSNLFGSITRALEKSAAPGLTLVESEVKCLLFDDDLVLLSPTKEGLQQHVDLLQSCCQTWTLTVNHSKTKIMLFQKKVQLPGPQIQIPSRHCCPRAHKETRPTSA